MARLQGFNDISIRKKTDEVLKKSRYQALAKNAANTKFIFAHQQMMEDFDEHPVTKEMMAGPEASESVGGILSYGNLPAFLGNEDSRGDVKKLREIFENINLSNSRPKIIQTSKEITYSFKISVPDVEDIYRKSEDSSYWSSKSWVELVENGVSNLGAFIFSLLGYPSSVSGTGLQRGKARANQRRSPKVKYVTEILNKFKSKFNFTE